MNRNKKTKKILTKGFLVKEYVKKRKSMVQIAKEIPHSFRTIRKHLCKYNIKIRTMSEAKEKAFKMLTKEFLQKEHQQNKKSIRQIAREVHCGHRVVYNHLKKFRIKIRTLDKKIWNKIAKILTKSFLKKEYLKNKKSAYQIAREIGHSGATVIKYLEKFNIKRRTPKENYELGKSLLTYIDGRTNKQYHCKDCGKKISYRCMFYGNRRCHSCANKEQHRVGTLNSKGKNNPNYRDGKSNEPYSLEFNEKLKEKIKKRDNYTCQNCGITEEEHIMVFGRVLSVHHIDYNKKNSKETNLITACNNCNVRANYNRDYWKKYYKKLMNAKVLGSPVKGK